MINQCPHERWQYCRIILSNGSPLFAIQCLDCLECLKAPRHNHKLWLKAKDIPENAPIHAYIKGPQL